MCFCHRFGTIITLFLSPVSTNLEEEMDEEAEGVLLQSTGCWLLKDGVGVIILGFSNCIHHQTCHVNTNTLTGMEIRSQVMLCLEM